MSATMTAVAEPISRDKLSCPECQIGSRRIDVCKGSATCQNCGHIWPVNLIEKEVVGKCPEEGRARGELCHLPVTEVDDDYGKCPKHGTILRADLKDCR